MVTEMAGRRVLVSGMGGDLGSRVASLLEAESWVGELTGLDVDPPRRRLHRASFHLVKPNEHDRIVELVTAFDPHVIVHLAVWEPFSRADPAKARRLTDEAAVSFLGAAAECRTLESIVVRSGTEVYGRARAAPSRPDESADVQPTCDYGRMLAAIEQTADSIGRGAGVAVGAIRMGTVLGPHVPSPLGRVLRMPAVPFSLLADPPFAVVEDVDVAAAFVAAARRRLAAPVNVVARGAITTLQAARRGRRVPIPLIGPEWRVATFISGLLGAPVPDHVIELFHRGRLADNSRMEELLGFGPAATTVQVVDKLYAWPSVIHVPARRAAA
jgi:UDP-glucose 4-epimerase